MREFDPLEHFEFKGRVYYRGSGLAAVGVRYGNHGSEPAGTLKKIHVNRHHIAKNKKDGQKRPVYTAKIGWGQTVYARSIYIKGPSHLVADDDQLSCGARVWIETNAELEYADPMTYAEVCDAFNNDVVIGED